MDLQTDLSDAERRVVEHAARGEICELGTGEPSQGAQWGEERVVRASVIYALCCSADGGSAVHAKGVRIRGARIQGMLDFEDAVLQVPLHLLRCYIGEPMCFERARLPVLCLTGSYTHGIWADGLYANEVVLDNGFSAKGQVRLLNATIGGVLSCIGGTFENPGGYALSADGLNCNGDVFLQDDFAAKGQVRLPGATIGGDLACVDGTFENPEGTALSADRLECKGDVFLTGDFSAKGEVRLLGATIGGNLACTGGTFENPEGDALLADGLECKGSVFLRGGFSAEGKIQLLGATIGGDLVCRNGRFENPRGTALGTDGLECKGSVFLTGGFSARGEVRLLNATIGGNLECTGGTFENPEGTALSAERLQCEGAVFLNVGFFANGEVRLFGATIGGNLVCRGSIFDGSLRLNGARVATLLDDRASWPASGCLHIDGLQYNRIEPADVKTRLEWLGRMPATPFSPQPYTQLATLLRSHGGERAASEILIAREKARAHRGPDPWWLKFWLRFLGVTIGYGYRPGRAVLGLVLVWILGWIVFSFDGVQCQIVHSIETDPVASALSPNVALASPPPPVFHPSLYSLDVLVPVVNLKTQEDWTVLEGWVSWFMRAEILLGWVLSTLAVLGFSGLVRKD